MSLTRHLKDPNSPVRHWFEINCNIPAALAIIQHHNALMPRVQYREVDFALVGLAVIQGIRYALGGWQCFEDTLVHDGAIDFHENLWSCLISSEPTSLHFAVMAGLEQYGRNDTRHPILSVLQGKALTGDKIQRSLEDIENLLNGIRPQLVADRAMRRFVNNPAFEGSALVGGADAQFIYGNGLYDIRTSFKRSPMTLENYWQQLGYFLLDFEDEYKIRELVWIYSRQRAAIAYPIPKLIANPREMREQFREFLIDLNRKESGYEWIEDLVDPMSDDVLDWD